MRISLLYTGRVPSRNRAPSTAKHKIRQQLHPQLRSFWKRIVEEQSRDGHSWNPFKDTERDGDVSLLKRSSPWTFASSVSSAHGWNSGCHLTFLFMEHSSSLQFGDIDNKVKTLVDALRLPTDQEAMSLVGPAADEMPLYCLLEDDRLVQSYTVDRRSLNDQSGDFVLIDAEIFAKQHTMFNSVIW